MFPDYKTCLVVDAISSSSTDNSSPFKLSMIYKCYLQTISLVADLLNVEAFIRTQLRNHHVNSICCIHLKIDFSKYMIPLREFSTNDDVLHRIVTSKDDYIRLTTNTLIE